MAELKSKRAPAVSSNERAWSQVYDDINDIIRAVNNQSGVDRLNTASGKDGDIRLFKDVDRTKYFIEGRFGDGWAKRELIFSDTSDAGQDETINFSSTESYVRPDGTVPFTAAQTGVTPSNNNHLATKQYVDDNVTDFSFTGDITGGSGSATIEATIANNAVENVMMANNSVDTSELVNNSVTYAKLQQINTDTFLGRDSAGTGNVEEITLNQLETMLNLGQYLSVASLNTLTDVTINNNTVGAGHYLRHNGTNFVNTLFNSADITGLQASQIPVIDINSKTTGTLPVNRGGTGATSGYNSSNWDTAYGWGDHSAAGYMSSFIITESDAGTSTINNGKYVKFASSNSGSHGNSTVTGSGSSSDPFVVTLNTPDTNTFQQTTFTLTADSGSNQTIAHGNTLDIEGGSAISTVVGSTDKVTINATGHLPTLAGLSATTGNFIVGSSGTFTAQSGATARASLGLGSAATQNTSAFLASDATGATIWTVSGDLTGNDLYVTTGYFRTNSSNGMQVLTDGGSANGTQSKWLYLDSTYINPSSMATGEIRCSLGRIGSSAAIPTNGKFIVGGVCNSSSSAVAQFAGFVRMRDYMIIHDGSSSSDAVGWQYGNGGLQTFSEGTGTQNVYAGADVVAYYSSDPRLKENVFRIKNPLKILDKIHGYTFDWKDYAKNVGTHLVGSDYGVMADEIEKVMPELVHDRNNGYKGVKYEKIVPLLIECIKEQQVQINQLKKWKEDKKWI